MIQVEIYDNEMGEHVITASGHAGYAGKGKDIVCAATSVLMYTLIEELEKLETDGDVTDCEVEENDIGMLVKFKGDSVEAKMACETILSGLQMLAEQYPDNLAVNRGEKFF